MLCVSAHSSHFTKLLSEVSWVDTENAEENILIDMTQQLLGRGSIQRCPSARLS